MSAYVALLLIHLHFPEAGSLKAKRKELAVGQGAAPHAPGRGRGGGRPPGHLAAQHARRDAVQRLAADARRRRGRRRALAGGALSQGVRVERTSDLVRGGRRDRMSARGCAGSTRRSARC